MTREPSWQRHAKFFDNAFGQLEQRQLSKIRSWTEANLAAPRPTMFYMFSGPDFLYADAFYSKASTYVLSALEPVGSVPDLTRLPPGGIGSALYSVERSLGSILSFSFFITKQMKTDLQAGQLSAAPCRSSMFSWRARARPSATSARSRSTTRALRISPTRIRVRTQRGASASCSPAAMAWSGRCIISRPICRTAASGSRGFLKFCATLAPGNSLLKSASYLLHSGNFTTVRDFILANSATIIQDDSGVPLAYYDPKKWRFFPFGRYAGPIDEFPGRYQPAYAELFQSQPADRFRHRLSLAHA